MAHSGIQPFPGRLAARWRGCQQHPVATVAGGVAAPGDQAFGDEPVDSPVGQGPAQTPDPTELTVGSEVAAKRPPVRYPLNYEGQADLFRQGQCRRREG